MDEPSMGLAPILVERSFEIIQQVHQSGVAMLVVRQNANMALSIADRGYVLDRQLILQGRPKSSCSTKTCERPTLAVEAATLAERCRYRFPIFEQQVYINSCSQGALSDSVRAAYAHYLADWDEKGAPWEYWVERQETARAAFAGLVNAGPDEIAVTTSLSAGVSALASGLRFTKRSKVVITDWEFPTIGQIWHAQEARGARVTHVSAADDGTIPLEHFERAIDDDTLIVALTHVCYRNGAMLDVPAVVELAHERGALVLLDAFQAIGSLPVDVAELGVDFLGAGVLKYLLGSAGLGFFYCRRDLVERVWPTQTGWFADENIFAMDHTDYSPARTAARFQSGTPPIPSIYAGIAGPNRGPVPIRHAAGAVHLCRHRRDRADAGDRNRGDARARAEPQCASARRPGRTTGEGRHAACARTSRRAHLCQVH
jgi:kynureninase